MFTIVSVIIAYYIGYSDGRVRGRWEGVGIIGRAYRDTVRLRSEAK